MFYVNYFKPFADRFFALCLLVAFAPIMLMCAIFIRYKIGSPVIFTQKRPGKDGIIFTIYKFRTMSYAVDDEGNLLPDEQRLCSVGKWIRKSSLDELPQLFNVLKGDMSFIGPRPLLPEYMELYSTREQRRHDVKPGITGLAQVNGRNAITWEDKLNFDITYVENISLALDIQIALLTVKKVLIREGINAQNAQGQATAEKFEGSHFRAAIYGAGGHAKVVADIAQMRGYDIVYAIDKEPKTFLNLNTITEEEFLSKKGIQTVFIAIGNNAIRQELYKRLKPKGYSFPALIHSCAIVAQNAYIAEAVVVCAGAIVNADAFIQEGVIINSGAIVEHDNHIEQFAHIAPHATLAGGVKVGSCSHIGAGSVVKELMSIGKNVIVGAGAVVVAPIANNKIVVGNPAKREL